MVYCLCCCCYYTASTACIWQTSALLIKSISQTVVVCLQNIHHCFLPPSASRCCCFYCLVCIYTMFLERGRACVLMYSTIYYTRDKSTLLRIILCKKNIKKTIAEKKTTRTTNIYLSLQVRMRAKIEQHYRKESCPT